MFLLWAMSKRTRTGGGTGRVLLGVSLIYLVVISIFLPKTAGERQWGPRYLLVIVPIVLLEGARLLASEWKVWGHLRRGIAAASVVFCFFAGGAVNGVRGPIHLWRDFNRRIYPMLETVRGSRPAGGGCIEPMVVSRTGNRILRKGFLSRRESTGP